MRPAGVVSPVLQLSVFLVHVRLCIFFLQSELTKQQNMFKIELKLLEDELLTRLSAAESNFLGDNVLVEKLETTKHTAAEIEMKVTSGLILFTAQYAAFIFSPVSGSCRLSLSGSGSKS